MSEKLLVPDIGEFENVEVIEILVKPGDQIKENDPVVTIESDKSSVEIPSILSGKVESVEVKVGDKVSEGDLLLNLSSSKILSKSTLPKDTENIIKQAETALAETKEKEIIFQEPVIEKKRGWHVRKPLDLDLIKKGAKKLEGTNDYSTFRASSCHAKSPIKTIKSIKIKSFKNRIQIEFKSQSFLQQQVRSMVGCLKYLGEKKWDLKTFDKIFKSKKRTLCAPPAPPEGLYLTRIIY